MSVSTVRRELFVPPELSDVEPPPSPLGDATMRDPHWQGGDGVAGDGAVIENVLRGRPDITDVAVFGVPSSEWGETVAAVIVPDDPAHTPDPDELRTFVGDQLRSSFVPEVVEFRDEVAYSETGKLLRRVLRTELSGVDD